MKQHPPTPSRLNFEFPEEARRVLKMQAFRLGISVRELATQAILEKLETLLQEDQEDIKRYEDLIAKYRKGELKTISHEEMMKKVGWDDL